LQSKAVCARIAPVEPLQCGAPVGPLATWKLFSKRNQNNFKNPRLPANRGFFVLPEREDNDFARNCEKL
jgi:hypothetical protein